MTNIKTNFVAFNIWTNTVYEDDASGHNLALITFHIRLARLLSIPTLRLFLTFSNVDQY